MTKEWAVKGYEDVAKNHKTHALRNQGKEIEAELIESDIVFVEKMHVAVDIDIDRSQLEFKIGLDMSDQTKYGAVQRVEYSVINTDRMKVIENMLNQLLTQFVMVKR